MCYRCQICNSVVPHNTPLRRFIVYRNVKGVLLEWRKDEAVYTIRKEIDREIPVCEECEVDLLYDTLATVMRRNWRPRLKGVPENIPLADLVPKEAPRTRRIDFGDGLLGEDQ